MDRLAEDLDSAAKTAEPEIQSLTTLNSKAFPASATDGASELYYPIMYFVDKSYLDSPSTCGGLPVGDPIIGSYNECATACNTAVGKCVGFGYFASGRLCFLFSEFSSVTYYTACDPAANATKCVASFQDFNGVSLTPDP